MTAWRSLNLFIKACTIIITLVMHHNVRGNGALTFPISTISLSSYNCFTHCNSNYLGQRFVPERGTCIFMHENKQFPEIGTVRCMCMPGTLL